MKHSYKNILVFHPAGIGDAVLGIPALKALRECFKSANIVLVTGRRALNLIENCPYVDEVLSVTLDVKKPVSLLHGERFLNVPSFISSVRQREFDLLVDLTHIGSMIGILKRVVLFRYFIRAKQVVGRNTDGRGFFLDIKVYDPPCPTKHEVEQCLDVARALGVKVAKPELELHISNTDRESVDDLLKKHGVEFDRLLIGICPNAFWPSKTWMKERFAILADRTIKEYDAQVAFVGGKSDVLLVEQICSMMESKAINLAGKTTLRQLAALIERCDLFTTNDSGPMHIAAAVKTRVVALFGPQTPVTHGPYCPEDAKVVLWKNLECSPCGKIECSYPKCMKLISVREVLTAVESLILRNRCHNQAIEQRAGFC